VKHKSSKPRPKTPQQQPRTNQWYQQNQWVFTLAIPSSVGRQWEKGGAADGAADEEEGEGGKAN
jgi:hypothetical protein